MGFYHVFNRGVEKRNIFMSESDYARFVHDLWEFNDVALTSHAIHSFRNLGLRNPSLSKKRIVALHGWCLMKNHYHLLIEEITDGGMTLFLRKLNIGYANYFNEKYSRSGALFQGRTKKKLIGSNAHYLHILHYIHLNPLDYVEGARQWRTGNIENPLGAKKRLDTYKWSSYQDYRGKDNFPSIISTDLFRDSIGSIEKQTLEYLKGNDTSAAPYILE